jgi:hypothetical protein
MRSFGKGAAGEKKFSMSASELLLLFLFKTVIPLLPIAGIFWLASVIMDAEITGSYRGISQPPIGEMILNLQEDHEQLFGTLSIARRARFQIEDGKMLDDHKMQMTLQKVAPGTSITGVPSKGGSKQIVESQMPTNLEGVESAAKFVGPVMNMTATKSQNDLEGQFELQGKKYTFTAQRSSLSAFLGKRWINRSLAYFGFKLN